MNVVLRVSGEVGFTVDIVLSNLCFAGGGGGAQGSDFDCFGKNSYALHCFPSTFYVSLFSALCTYMLATVEGESKNAAETLKKWQDTEISMRKLEEARQVLSFLCNGYVIPVITCV